MMVRCSAVLMCPSRVSHLQPKFTSHSHVVQVTRWRCPSVCPFLLSTTRTDLALASLRSSPIVLAAAAVLLGQTSSSWAGAYRVGHLAALACSGWYELTVEELNIQISGDLRGGGSCLREIITIDQKPTIGKVTSKIKLALCKVGTVDHTIIT